METPQSIKDEAEKKYPFLIAPTGASDHEYYREENRFIAMHRSAYIAGRLASQKEIEELRAQNTKVNDAYNEIYRQANDWKNHSDNQKSEIEELREENRKLKEGSSKLLEALKRMYYIFVEIGFREDGELAAPFNEVLSACESAKAQIKAYES